VEKDGQSFKITKPQLETPEQIYAGKNNGCRRYIASRDYCLLLLLLVFARGMDFLSTWIAKRRNLVLEGNPLAKKLGWKWAWRSTFVLCGALRRGPLSAIVVATASVLCRANFSVRVAHAFARRGNLPPVHVERVQETRITVYLLCLAGNTLLTAGVGAALIYFSHLRLAPFAIGMGMVAYAVAWRSYTLLAIWRIRHAAKKLAARQNSCANDKSLTVDLWFVLKYAHSDKIISPCTHDNRMNFETGRAGQRDPITRRLLADIETPLSAYRKIRGQANRSSLNPSKRRASRSLLVRRLQSARGHQATGNRRRSHREWQGRGEI